MIRAEPRAAAMCLASMLIGVPVSAIGEDVPATVGSPKEMVADLRRFTIGGLLVVDDAKCTVGQERTIEVPLHAEIGPLPGWIPSRMVAGLIEKGDLWTWSVDRNVRMRGNCRPVGDSADRTALCDEYTWSVHRYGSLSLSAWPAFDDDRVLTSMVYPTCGFEQMDPPVFASVMRGTPKRNRRGVLAIIYGYAMWVAEGNMSAPVLDQATLTECLTGSTAACESVIRLVETPQRAKVELSP